MKNYPVKSVNDIFRDRFGGKFSDHQPLSEVMPMGMGGVSSLFVDALTVVDLVDAAKLAVANKRPYRVIGAGTATLIGESGFPGLIIKNSTRNIFRLDNSSRVVCDSGVDNALLVNSMASQGLGGIELLVTVPGTVGGATITNAQSSNWKFLSYIREICIFDPDLLKIRTLEARELGSKLISSLFSANLVFPPVLLTVTVQLAMLSQQEIIRRLSAIKNRSTRFPAPVLGNVFSGEFKDIEIGREFNKQLKILGLAYDNKRDWLMVKRSSTPSKVRQGLTMLGEKIQQRGVENHPRITYLGYYQEDDEH